MFVVAPLISLLRYIDSFGPFIKFYPHKIKYFMYDNNTKQITICIKHDDENTVYSYQLLVN